MNKPYPELKSIGQRIRHLRQQKGMTVTELARRCKVTRSYISQVERGLVSPSIPSLHAIARNLGVPAFHFFVTEETLEPLVPAEARVPLTAPPAGQYYLLSPPVRRKLALFLLVLQPKASSIAQDFGHAGEEAAYLFSGQVEVHLGERKYYMKPGDCIQFESSVPHRYVNTGADVAEMLICVSPPI